MAQQEDEVVGAGIMGFGVEAVLTMALIVFLNWSVDMRRKSEIVQSVQRTTRYEWSDVRIVGCTVEHKTEGWKP